MSAALDKLRAYLARFPHAPDDLALDLDDYSGLPGLTFGDLRALRAEGERRERLLGNAASWLSAVTGLRTSEEVRTVFALAKEIEKELLPSIDPARVQDP